MRYTSTRGEAAPASFSEAILAGLAPDGGLYVPQRFPAVNPEPLRQSNSFSEQAAAFLAPFLDGDALAPELDEMCAKAFDFALPLERLDDTTSVLELFHGPTAAFKDFGARFLAECFERLGRDRPPADAARLTVLVATSGDTGSAVAAAFHRKSNVEVGVLFPRDGVSPRQRHQLACWDANVRSFAVRGSFDDCQRLVKQAFRDPDWSKGVRLTSANSINIGRLLPQAAFYAAAATRFARETGEEPGFVIPSGNLGNSVGAFWAKQLGFPVRRVALACNANRTVPDWFADGEWRPRASVKTLANAMDVGDPSNMERLFHLYPKRESFLADAEAWSIDDATIRATIAEGPQRWGRIWCPHTATAVHCRGRLDKRPWVIVSTAHPAKFDSIVEPLIGRRIDVPRALQKLLDLPESFREIDADLNALRDGLGGA